MFLRLYKYGLLICAREKMMVFWSLLFPVVLGTLFQMSFGGTMDSIEFQKIPTAYVVEEGADTSFTELLEKLEKDSELVEVRTLTKEEAQRLLKEGDVDGIFYNSKADGITLTVTEQNMNQSILSSILEQYERTLSTFTNIGREAPQKIAAAASLLEEESKYLREENISDEPKSDMMDFFYALIAMNCLMGATAGVACALNFKADLSDLGGQARHRQHQPFSDFIFGFICLCYHAVFVYVVFYLLSDVCVESAVWKPFGNDFADCLSGKSAERFSGILCRIAGKNEQYIERGHQRHDYVGFELFERPDAGWNVPDRGYICASDSPYQSGVDDCKSAAQPGYLRYV